MQCRRVLVLFGKPPRPGGVKTRLIPAIGAAGAARLYGAFLSDVSSLSRPYVDEVVLAMVPPLHAGAPPAEWPVRVVIQRGDDLAARLIHSFDAEFEAGAGAVVVRNTDSPLLPAAREEEAFERLERGNEVVLGPDDGGGYYLVGLRRPRPELFRDVPMSVPNNYTATVARARTLTPRVSELCAEPDVDTPEDLTRLAIQLESPEARHRAPRTAAEVARLRDLRSTSEAW